MFCDIPLRATLNTITPRRHRIHRPCPALKERGGMGAVEAMIFRQSEGYDRASTATGEVGPVDYGRRITWIILSPFG
jgi:hypothetical protein